MQALGIRLISDIPENLIPHFKFTFYSDADTIVGITPMYQDERGLMENIIRVPASAQSAVFSIWTISKEPGSNYSYSLRNLTLKDLTGTVNHINMSFDVESQCLGNCDLYIRALKSRIGGQLSVSLNESEFLLNTKIPETGGEDRYQWEYAGKVGSTGNTANITLVNKDGFNSVNALVLLSEKETQELNRNITGSTQTDQENLALASGTPVANTLLITERQINPTKYEIKTQNSGGGNNVIGLAKPFSKNWVLYPGNIEARLLNGYINGWEISDLKDGTYYIEYKPQKYFIIGAFVSGISAILAISYLGVTYFRRDSPSERRSSSQG